jgi:hypothetical protein
MDLHGTWKLVAATARDLNSGEVKETLGRRSAIRFVSYRDDGRIISVVAYDYDLPMNDEGALITEEARSKTMEACSGTYAVSGFSVEHEIETAWDAIWVGRRFICDINFEGGNLILTSRPLMDSSGRSMVLTAVWNKVRWSRL